MATEISSPRPIIKAASACVWRGDDVLLVERGKALGQGMWSLPGGKLEMGEAPVEAAARELLEETNVRADLQQHVGDFSVDAGEVRYVISCFTGHFLAGEATAMSDARSVAWVNWQQISAFRLAPNITEAVTIARNLISL